MSRSGAGAGADPTLRVGIEIELLAPPGGSRFALADTLAAAVGGSVNPTFHRDTEPSNDRRWPRFHHLSQAVAVHDGDGRLRCRMVDDTTIRDDLDVGAAPPSGRFRIISDELRLIRLAERQLDPGAPMNSVLEPLAALYGTPVEPVSRGRLRLDDAGGSTVAMVIPQGGERERVCEIVTRVIEADHRRVLGQLLEPARSAGFVVPGEAAVHVHLDAGLFRHGARFAHLVRLFATRRDWLRERFATNPRCRRLGPVPDELVALIDQSGFEQRPWDEIEAALLPLKLVKYRDLNLVNLVQRTPGKDTVEIRILPGSIDADAIIDQVVALEQLVLP